MDLGQPLFGALQLTLELFQAGGCAHSPPVELGAEQHHSIMAVARIRACHLELAGGAHDSKSTTEYA